jgi:tetratricopeptide (TPR) repeat protein
MTRPNRQRSSVRPARRRAAATVASTPRRARPARFTFTPPTIAALLAVLTFALYLPTLSNDFVQLDDPEYVLDNPVVQRGVTLDGVRWAFTTTRFSNWLPVTWLSHMLDCELFGLWAGGHHLTSALLHAANAALVFLLLRAATGSLWRAAAVAALFAAHPLRVESVAWVAERKDVLCATFALLAMLAWVGYCRTGCPGRYVAALVLYALGLMSKTMIVTLPFLLLLLDVWPLRRVSSIGRFLVTGPHDAKLTGAASTGTAGTATSVAVSPTATPPIPPDNSNPRFPAHGWGRLVLEKLPLLALAAIASAWTAALQRSGGAMLVGEQLSAAERLGNAVVSVPRYLWKTLRPVDLSPFYPHPGSWPAWAVAASAAMVVGSVVAVLLAARTRPYLAVGWFWFLGMLVPVSGIVQVGAQSMADRYTYLPGIGLTVLIVWGIADLAGRAPRLRQALRPATAGVLAVLAVGSVLQQRYWAGTVELFEHAVAVDPNNWLAHGMLGIAAHDAVDDARAVEHYRKSIAANPTHPDAMHNLGVSLKTLGQLDEALAAFREAARHGPPQAVTYGEIGQLLAARRDWPAADAAFAEAERLAPGSAVYAIARGGVALEMGRHDVGAEHFRRALQLDPQNADARRGLDEATGERAP